MHFTKHHGQLFLALAVVKVGEYFVKEKHFDKIFLLPLTTKKRVSIRQVKNEG
jgi:hypothetical protein